MSGPRRPGGRMDRVLWEDHVTLRDGTEIHVRAVRPSDRPCLEAGWSQLSEHSRLFRFLGPRDDLSESELQYLTDFDGVDHYALGAVTRGTDGVEHPVAIARFVRGEKHPRCADFAIVVVDAHQRKGVGLEMSRRLVDAAKKRGITTFRADVLRENDGAKHMIRALFPEAQAQAVGAVLKFRLPLSQDAQEDDCGGPSVEAP